MDRQHRTGHLMKQTVHNNTLHPIIDLYSVFSPFTFTGKERDEETGYGYFGARYMDHELMTMWLSVDRYADKYPFISPYAYCAWNPLRLTDPSGDSLDVAGGKIAQNDIHSIVCPEYRDRMRTAE